MMNAQNAYLNSRLDKMIYMNIPESVEHLSGQVCELLKSIYGLKQSANLWNKKITKTLKSLGFEQTLADVSVFIHFCDMIVALYINDMLFFSKNLKKMKHVKNKIKKLHIMKNLKKKIKKGFVVNVTKNLNYGVRIPHSGGAKGQYCL